jgi:hypothetical protein
MFNAIDWEIMLTKKDWKKLIKRMGRINKKNENSESIS